MLGNGVGKLGVLKGLSLGVGVSLDESDALVSAEATAVGEVVVETESLGVALVAAETLGVVVAEVEAPSVGEVVPAPETLGVVVAEIEPPGVVDVVPATETLGVVDEAEAPGVADDVAADEVDAVVAAVWPVVSEVAAAGVDAQSSVGDEDACVVMAG
jgi:hypothetical protein